MSDIEVCVLDCSGIQSYVFGSNLMKSNLGGSRLVEKVYEDWLEETAIELFGDASKFDFESWRGGESSEQEEIAYSRLLLAETESEGLMSEAAYIGGGNAVLMFRREGENSLAEAFVRIWSRILLVETPGLRPMAAISQGSLDNPIAAINDAFDRLPQLKNAWAAETQLPRHGMTQACKRTGFSIEATAKLQGNIEHVSSVATAKIKHEKEATNVLTEKFKDVIGEYRFDNQLDHLGQSKNARNHVAVVHIDGNRIGEKFKQCKTLAAKRKLSVEVRRAAEHAMAETLKDLKKQLRMLEWEIGLSLTKNKYDQEALPIRPMILGGDDVTFVCDARLAFYLTKTFIEHFEKYDLGLKQPKIGDFMRACAGIAIIRTKYPFYRGYKLAEKLCDEAKKKSRSENDSSWLDFHISYRGMSGGLKEMRERNYEIGGDSLLWRPWKLTNEVSEKSFGEFKRALRHLLKWPSSKRAKLASALMQGPEATQHFIAIENARGLTLPKFPGDSGFETKGWTRGKSNEGKTPFYDILEAADFYPECLLQNGEAKDGDQT